MRILSLDIENMPQSLYGQQGDEDNPFGSGTLEVTSGEDNAGIGSIENVYAGRINVHGGNIDATGGKYGACIVHTTEIYADVVMEKKADAVNLMNGLLG